MKFLTVLRSDGGDAESRPVPKPTPDPVPPPRDEPQPALLPAGLPQRLAAYSLDIVILLVGLVIVQAALYAFNPIVAIARQGRQVGPGQLHAWVFATATLPFLLYFAVTTASQRQATPGMRAFGLRVEMMNGHPVRFGRALLRSAILLIPFEINHAVVFWLGPRDSTPSWLFVAGIAVVWVLISTYVLSIRLSPFGQSVHDRVAGTVVSRTAGFIE